MSREPRCIVIGAGQPPARTPDIRRGDLLIAADGGYAHAMDNGLRPDVHIGDFDSAKTPPATADDGMLTVRLPREKDRTDMLAALQHGLECGYGSFHIYGGVGGRLDHTMANIQCLSFLAGQGAKGFLYDGEETVVTVLRGQMKLSKAAVGTVSVFAEGGAAEGVTLRGMKYALESARLTCDFPRGVSNELIGSPALIEVKRGSLLVFCPAAALEQELDAPRHR